MLIFSNKEEENCTNPSPRGSFQKFRELLKSNNLVVDDNEEKLSTPRMQHKNFTQNLLTGSKMSTKTNCDTDIKDDILISKLALSPNLRYRQWENNNDHSSLENKIIITDELKFSNYDSANEDSQKEESQRESGANSNKLETLKVDSLIEYKELDCFPLMKSPPVQTDNILFSVKIPKDQFRNDEDINNPVEEEKLYVHSKLEFVTAQLPLHSISEDVNSPYFASSPSNITAYVRGQGTSNKEKSDDDFEQKHSSPSEINDEWNSGDKNEMGATVQTITSISDNYIENANLDTLEMKLEKIMK